VRYRAERCETAKMDFKSPAHAIPPLGPGMAKLSYQIANGNMGPMELASKRSWLNADAVRCDGSRENQNGAGANFEPARSLFQQLTDLTAYVAAFLRPA